MKLRLAAVFITSHADTVGNSIRLNILEYLSEVFTLVLFTNQKMSAYKKFSNIELRYITKRNYQRVPILSELIYWRNIAKSINKEAVDMVFLFHDTAPISMWLNHACIQYVHQVHEMIGLDRKRLHQKITQKIREFFILKGLKKAKTLFVVSQTIIDYLEKRGLKNLILTPHAVYLSLYRNPYITDFHQDIIRLKNEGNFVVTYTGWVAENRGLWLMLDSLKEAAKGDSRIVFVIAGCEKKYLDIINQFVKGNGLDKHILSYGRIDHTLIPGILAYSDVCLSFLEVNPVYEMSPPQKVIEYFAAGRPVIGNKIKTHELFIKDGVNGFIVNEKPTEVLAKLLMLSSDKPMLEKLSLNASQTAKSYDFTRIYGAMVHEIKRCVDGQ